MGTDLTFATDRFPQAIRFVLVNNRVPRTDQHCALCGGPIEKGYVRDSRTQLIYCAQCWSMRGTRLLTRMNRIHLENRPVATVRSLLTFHINRFLGERGQS